MANTNSGGPAVAEGATVGGCKKAHTTPQPVDRQSGPDNQAGRMPLARLIGRQVLPVGIAGVIVWLLAGRLGEVDTAAIIQSVMSLQPQFWLLALVATAVSFRAVGQYDAVLHRLMGTGVPPAQARRAGIAAIAVSQTLGFGIITGGLVRWRLLPGFTLWKSTQLSISVGVSFLAGWAVVTAAAFALLPVTVYPVIEGGVSIPHSFLSPLAWAVLAVAAFVGVMMVMRPRWQGRTLPGVPLPAIGRIIGLAAVDTGAAALAFWCLVPEAAGLGFAEVVPAFLLALGAGLVSGSPGGIGPFEMVLLMLLPHVPAEPLLAGVVAFRLVYYALPAVLGGLLLVLGPRKGSAPASRLLPPGQIGPDHAALLEGACRAEVRLLRQGVLGLLPDAQAGAGWMVARTAQALVAVSDPFSLHRQPGRTAMAACAQRALLADLRTEARAGDRVACLYKCGARTAAIARAAGFVVVPVTEEAWLVPARFAMDAPSRSQLRRKLRKARKADLCISAATGALPLAEMARVSAAWVAARGGERGFSMGRFSAANVAPQRIYLARSGGRLVAFLTLHQCRSEWTLDLMRHTPEMPEGTMQMLLVQAIGDAAAQGVPRLSLAAARPPAPAAAGMLRRKLNRLVERAGGTGGLRQFKASFAPHWEPLYIAAPSRGALLLAAADIFREVMHPPAHAPERSGDQATQPFAPQAVAVAMHPRAVPRPAARPASDDG